ncbi:MAG: DsrE/DsrF/DrsH-like family protein [Polyangiaceae bacterium]|nr:DsrE/DsrF/DrsH-like family protein [Polyangiaceae bacterium]
MRLATAARKLPGDGTLLVRADDEAFPLDVKSWCKSSGAELLSLDRTAEGFAAHIKLKKKADSAPMSAKVPAAPPSFHKTLGLDLHEAETPSSPLPAEVTLDCRGLQCPEPVLQISKAARGNTSPLRILADDPAFELDLKSWCRTTGATLVSLDRQGATMTAVVLSKAALAARAASAPAPHSSSPPATGPIAAITRASESEVAPTSSAATSQAAIVVAAPARAFAFDLDLRGVEDPSDLERRLGGLATVGAGLTAKVTVSSVALAQVVLRWAPAAGHSIEGMTGPGPVVVELRLASEESAPFSRAGRGAIVSANADNEADCALLVLHNDLESLLAAMLIANGAAALGQRVVVFFTFWGLNLLRGEHPNEAAPREKVSFIQRMFKWMMPKGPRRQQLGQLNFGGAGPLLMRGLMRDKNLSELPRLVEQAQEQGVKFVACTMSMSVMGITKRDLAPYKNLDFGGVAYFVAAARGAQVSLVF